MVEPRWLVLGIVWKLGKSTPPTTRRAQLPSHGSSVDSRLKRLDAWHIVWAVPSGSLSSRLCPAWSVFSCILREGCCMIEVEAFSKTCCTTIQKWTTVLVHHSGQCHPLACLSLSVPFARIVLTYGYGDGFWSHWCTVYRLPPT